MILAIFLVAMGVTCLFSAFVALFLARQLKVQTETHSTESQRMADLFSMTSKQSDLARETFDTAIRVVMDTAKEMAEQSQRNCQEMLTHLSSTISLLVSPPPAPDSQPTLNGRPEETPPWETLRHPAEGREFLEAGGTAPPAGWSTDPAILHQMRNLPDDVPGPLEDPQMDQTGFDPSP